jgi:hypothetical protein
MLMKLVFYRKSRRGEKDTQSDPQIVEVASVGEAIKCIRSTQHDDVLLFTGKGRGMRWFRNKDALGYLEGVAA